MCWRKHVLKVGPRPLITGDELPEDERLDGVEPWLSAIFQSEHLSLLAGSGLTIALATEAGVKATSMAVPDPPWTLTPDFTDLLARELTEHIVAAANESAKKTGRGNPNIEDQIRVSLGLLDGLSILRDTRLTPVATMISALLSSFLRSVLQTEADLRAAFSTDSGAKAVRLLVSFLLSFASRTAARDRLNLFTLNYDRLIEYGCDLAGFRVLDRFIGALSPVFRAARVEVDYHYNPPGIRGEPRYLEGVVRFAKLHGSVDWRSDEGEIRRIGLPFGAALTHPDVPADPLNTMMIYPNPAKDVETYAYPYAELFRDFSAAICRPNSTLVTYGYGFGDHHVNRVIQHMLTLPSTHLVIISYDGAEGRIERFYSNSREAQISLLIGSHFGDLATIVERYLPKPAIDNLTMRETELRARRGQPTRHADTTALTDRSSE